MSTKKIVIMTLSALLLAGLATTGAFSLLKDRHVYISTDQVTVTINPEIRHQTMKGFGASGAWWAQDVGGWDELAEIMDYLYNSEKGIGLNIYRFNIGAGPKHDVEDPWRRTETFEVAPGVYDWTRDANAVHVMEEAVVRGADEVVMFANSPPGRMTRNGFTSGDSEGKSNFKTGMEAAYARYLVDIAEHFREEGIPVTYLSPINEPQWDWKSGQEGCHYEPEEIPAVARAVVEELNSRNSPIKISLIETGQWTDMPYTLDLYDTLMRDPVIGEGMDHFAGHSYWTNSWDKIKVANLYDDKATKLPIHMTEWCQMAEGMDLGMDAAMVLARTVHEDLTILNAVTWEQWLAVSCYDYKDGLVYVDKITHEVMPAKRMWALGNWSRYLSQGDVRVEAISSRRQIQVSAFERADGSYVVVAVNHGDQTQLSVEGMDGKHLTVIETSDAKELATVYEGKKKASIELAAKSISTLIFE